MTQRRIKVVRAAKAAFCAVAAAAPFFLTVAALSFSCYISLTVVVLCIAAASFIAASLPASPSSAALLIDSKLQTKERLISALAVTSRSDTVASLIRQQAEAVACPVTPPLKLPRWAVLAVWLYLPAALLLLMPPRTAPPQHPIKLQIIDVSQNATKSLKKHLQREAKEQPCPSKRRLLHLTSASEREVKKVHRLLTEPKIAALLAKIAAGKGAGSGEGVGRAAETIRRTAATISINDDLAALLRQLANAVRSKNRPAIKRLLSQINASISSITRTVQRVKSIIRGTATPVPGEGEERAVAGTQKPSVTQSLSPQTRLALVRAERYPPALKAAVIRYFRGQSK